MASSRSRLNRQLWIGVALSFYAFIAIGMVEGGLGVLIPSIQEAYQLTPATFTFIFLSQTFGYFVAALASSLLSSRMGLARMLLLATSSLMVSVIVYAAIPSWVVMVLVGVLLGLGIGLIDAGINTFIASDQRNADLTGFLHAFYGIGALLGPAIATTLLVLNWHWRLVYWFFAGVVGLTVLGMLWAIAYNYRPLTQKVVVSSEGAGASLKTALKMPIVLLAAFFLAIYVGVEVSVGGWAYSVQYVNRGTSEMLAGYSISAYWCGLTAGRLGMGRVVKYLGASRTMNLTFALLGAGLLVWWLFPNQIWSLPLIGLGLGPIFPLTIWLMPQRIVAPLVPAAIGFMTSMASMGAALVPSVVGWFATVIGLEVIPILMLPLALVLVILNRQMNRHPVVLDRTQ